MIWHDRFYITPEEKRGLICALWPVAFGLAVTIAVTWPLWWFQN